MGRGAYSSCACPQQWFARFASVIDAQASCRRQAGVVALVKTVLLLPIHRHLCHHCDGIVALVGMVSLPLPMCRRLAVIGNDGNSVVGDDNKDNQDNATDDEVDNDDGNGAANNDINNDCNGATGKDDDDKDNDATNDNIDNDGDGATDKDVENDMATARWTMTLKTMAMVRRRTTLMTIATGRQTMKSVMMAMA